MKKNIIYGLAALLFCSVLASCLPKKAEEALIYKGPTVVEVKNQNFGQLATALTAKFITAAANDSTRTVLLNSKVTDSILVQLVGPQRETPIVINYTVRPATMLVNGATVNVVNGSTAVEGTNFNFRVPNARTVTFAPFTSQAYILVDMIPSSIPTVGATKLLTIDVTGNAEIVCNPNYNKFLLTLRR